MMTQSPKRLLLSLLVLFAVVPNCVCVHGAKQPEPEVSLEVEVVAAAEESALMGKLFPLFGKIFKRGEVRLSFKQVFKAITDLVDERELAILATIGWGLVPITQNLYEGFAKVTKKGLLSDEEDLELELELDLEAIQVPAPRKSKGKQAYEYLTNKGMKVDPETAEIAKKGERRMRPFRNRRVYHIVEHVSQAAKIGVSVIAVDALSLISRMMGYNPWNIMDNISNIYSHVVYTGWITLRLQALKRYFLHKAFRRITGSGSDLGKLNVFDNLANGVLSLVWMFYMLNYLEMQTGVALKSIFSIGATGTLIFGLASKDIATQIMSGLSLHLSDKVFEGDDVRFSDGTQGKIEKLGWFETMIRSSDELVVGIPNTQLSEQRIYNLSRTPRSQVKQELRVSYDDAAKINALLDAIKEEIKKDCPKLITDGSRPFRAHWRDYKDDHLQVVVDCHFKISPTGGEYWDNRQTVLEAIDKAAKKTGVKFEKLVRVGYMQK